MRSVLLVVLLLAVPVQAAEPTAKAILAKTGTTGGVIVHAGCGRGKLTAQFAGPNTVVQGLDTDAGKVAEARTVLRTKGYGRASAAVFDGRHLPYAENVVNLVVVSDAFDVENAEILRVLVPGGTAYIREPNQWRKIVKPRPAEMDEWTHYLYDASNNAVSKDRLVGPPGGLQWVAAPKFSRSHEQLASVSGVVSAGGRLFSIEDHGPIESVAFPPKWRLVARDAFNGITLWQREVGPWEWHLHLFRSGPFHLARRLVAVGERVYVTLGLGRPVEMLDAATGKTLKTFSGTEGADEFIHTGELLLVYIGHSGPDRNPNERVKGAAKAVSAGRKKRRGSRPREKPDGKERSLLAIDPGSGEVVWKNKVPAAIHLTLCAGNGRVVYQQGGRLSP